MIFLFSLLVIDTILIAAAGNVINDVYDENSDELNNKLKLGIPKITCGTARTGFCTKRISDPRRKTKFPPGHWRPGGRAEGGRAEREFEISNLNFEI